MLRRLPITVALATLITVALLIATVWAIAISSGHTALLWRESHGNHGPWRHHVTLRHLDNYATIYTFTLLCPMAGLGALIERSTRSAIVSILAFVALLVSCAHFPLFD